MRLDRALYRVLGDRGLARRRPDAGVKLMRTSFREKAGSADLGQLESAGSSMELSERVEVRRAVLMEARWKF